MATIQDVLQEVKRLNPTLHDLAIAMVQLRESQAAINALNEEVGRLKQELAGKTLPEE